MPARPAACDPRPCSWLWVWAVVSAAWIAAYVRWTTGTTGDAIYLSFAATCAGLAWVLAARQPSAQRRTARFHRRRRRPVGAR
jgi:hypothetical protein